jgi:L-ascorbate metabolism protein UlaG (beta-lactamase superfamily)
MTGKALYFKPNVVIEPLMDRWYAWSHLISAPTAAMNIKSRHLSIMESYITSPEIHAEAVLNPLLRGGPFIDVEGDRADDIEALMLTTMEKQKDLLELAAAIKHLDKLLLDAKGYGLEAIYKDVPDLLKGYVELYYDRNNNASFRFFEALFYKSKFYKKASQSIALWITNNDQRPFCLSTPRLDNSNVLHLDIAFDNEVIDILSKMKREPQTLDFIKNKLGISKDQEAIFETFFTETPPPAYQKYTGDKVRMRYFGHACILIETSEVSILVDPLISYYGYHSDIEHFSDMDLPDVIDFVLITHNHQDHILFETLLPLRHKIKNIVVPRTSSGKLEDPDLGLMFNNIGFHNVLSIGEMETIRIGEISITGLPFIGEHSDLNILTKSCYLVKVKSFQLLFLADSRILEPKLYENIHNQVGDVDVMFLGMECDGAPLSWLYGPLMPKKLPRDMDGSRRLSGSDCEKGMSLVDIFNPKEVFVYAMGQEPWLEFISSIKYSDESNPIIQSNKLVDLCHARGITAERLFGEKELLYNKELAGIV